jgi:hypothetical protein
MAQGQIFTSRAGVVSSAGGAVGPTGPIGPAGPIGSQGPIGPAGQGLPGPAPAHQWENTALRFQNSDESWGDYTDLSGVKGSVGPRPKHDWNDAKTAIRFEKPLSEGGGWSDYVTITGERGLQGDEGGVGLRGDFGGNSALYTFDYLAVAPAAPYSGTVTFFESGFDNNADGWTQPALWIHDSGKLNVDHSDWVSSLGSLDNDIKGNLRILKEDDPTKYANYLVSGEIGDSGVYSTIPLSFVESSDKSSSPQNQILNVFADDDPLILTFTQFGETGARGAKGDDGKDSQVEGPMGPKPEHQFSTVKDSENVVGYTQLRFQDEDGDYPDWKKSDGTFSDTAPNVRGPEGPMGDGGPAGPRPKHEFQTASNPPSQKIRFQLPYGENDPNTIVWGAWQEIKGEKGDSGDDGDRYSTTSASEVSIGPVGGEKTFTIEANLSYTTGQDVVIALKGDVTKLMLGTVKSYAGTTLKITVTDFSGAGTPQNPTWVVNLGGAVGPEGGPGPAPEHQWDNTSLRFQNADASWGNYANLVGSKGDIGGVVYYLSVVNKSSEHPQKGNGSSKTFALCKDGPVTCNNAVQSPDLHLIKGYTYYFNQKRPSNNLSTDGHPINIYTGNKGGPNDTKYDTNGSKGVTEKGTLGDDDNPRILIFKVPLDAPDELWYGCENHDYMGGKMLLSRFGPSGLSPDHQWNDTSLRFQKPDASWGNYVDLKGSVGPRPSHGFKHFGEDKAASGSTPATHRKTLLRFQNADGSWPAWGDPAGSETNAPDVRGPIGPAGPKGEGVKGDTGPTGINWQGQWEDFVLVDGVNQPKVYYVKDAVHYNGSAYYCIKQTAVSELPTKIDFWSLLAKKGDEGNPSVVPGPRPENEWGVDDTENTSLPVAQRADNRWKLRFKESAQAWGDWSATLRGVTGPYGNTGPRGPYGGDTQIFKWDGAITVSAINDTKIKINKTDLSLADKIVVSHKNLNDVDCSVWLKSLDATKGARLKMVKEGPAQDPNTFAVYEISEAADESLTGFIVFNVKYIHHNGVFVGDDEIALTFAPAAEGPMGPKGEDGATATNGIFNITNGTKSGSTRELVARWTMNDIDGTTLKDEKGKHNASITGATQVDGKFGKALRFDGPSNYVVAQADFGLGKDAFTISTWVYVENAAAHNKNYCVIISNGYTSAVNAAGGSIALHLGMDDHEDEYCYVLDSSHRSTGIKIKYGQWVHYAMVREGLDADQLKLYIDGELVKTDTCDKSIYSTRNEMVLGAFSTITSVINSNYFTGGLIDDVRIYKGGASAAEIEALGKNEELIREVFSVNNAQSPDIEVIRGFTYEFNQEHESNVGHLIKLATKVDGADNSNYDKGWIYTGAPGDEGKGVWTVPADTEEETIYYYCAGAAHYGEGGKVSIKTGQGSGGEQGSSGERGETTKLSSVSNSILTIDKGHKIENKGVDLEVSSNGLISHWKMDNVYGAHTLLDENGNHPGELKNFTSNAMTLGKFGGAVKFDGVNNYIDVGLHDDFVFEKDFTVSMWFKRERTGREGLFGQSNAAGENTSSSWMLEIDPSNKLRAIAFSSTGESADSVELLSNDAITDTSWHHVVFRREGDTWNLFVDNQEQAYEQTKSMSLNIATKSTKIGWMFKSFKGSIDDVRMYRRALTENEISLLNASSNSLPVPLSTMEGSPILGTIVKAPVWHNSMDNLDGNTIVSETGENIAVMGSGASSADAKFGKGVLFGSSSYGVVVNPSGWNRGTKPFTISWWVQPNSSPSSYGVHFNYQGGGGWNNGLMSYSRPQGDEWYILGTIMLKPNIGHAGGHMAITRDGASVKIYHNGSLKLEHSVDANREFGESDSVLTIAARSDGSHRGIGWMDEIRMHDFAATSEEIQFLASDNGDNDITEGGTLESLTAGWTMDDIVDSTLNEETGNHPGTITGATVVDGKFGKALNFDGSHYVDCGVHDDWTDGLKNDFAISFWAKRESQKKRESVLGAWPLGVETNSQGSWFIEFKDNKLRAVIISKDDFTKHVDISSSTIIADTEWHHYVVQRIKGKMEMWVDNVDQTNLHPLAPWRYEIASRSGLGLTIGKAYQYFTGDIDDVQILQGGLHKQDIALLYEGKSLFRDDIYYIPKIGASAAKFDGSSYLVSPAHEDWKFGKGDFTVETWIKPSQLEVGGIIGAGDAGDSSLPVGWKTSIEYGGKIAWYDTTTGSASTVGRSVEALKLDQWQHVAFVRHNGILTIYIDGKVGSEKAHSTNLNYDADLLIGKLTTSTSSRYFKGKMDAVRIAKEAIYTKGFSPSMGRFGNTPETKLLLHFDEIIDSSSNAHQIKKSRNSKIAAGRFGRGSAIFDGESSYLSVPPSNDWVLVGDWTVEFWMNTARYDSDSSYVTLVGNTSASGASWSDIGWVICQMPDGKIMAQEGYTSTTITSADPVPIGSWHHIAFVRSGTTRILYIDGRKVGSAATGNQPTRSAGRTWPVRIGTGYQPNAYYKGLIDEVRISDKARYTKDKEDLYDSQFVPDGSTKLLLHFDEDLTDSAPDSGYNIVKVLKDISGVGKWTGGSLANVSGSDNLSKYIDINHKLDPNLGINWSEDYTFDFWYYITGSSVWEKVLSFSTPTASLGGGTIWMDNAYFKTGQISMSNWIAGSTNYRDFSPVAIPIDQWSHFAFEKKGDEYRVYVNGMIHLKFTHLSDSVRVMGMGTSGLEPSGLLIGETRLNYPHYNFNGRISDLRASQKALYNVGSANKGSQVFNLVGTDVPDTKFVDLASPGRAIVEGAGSVKHSTASTDYNDGSILFDGDTSRLDVDYNADFGWTDSNTSNLQIEAWVYADALNGNKTIMGLIGDNANWTAGSGNSTGIQWYLQSEGNGSLISFSYRLSNDQAIQLNVANSTSGFGAGAWHHIAFSMDGTTASLYIDGTRRASSTSIIHSSSSFTGGTPKLRVGAFPTTAGHTWNGWIDDVRIIRGIGVTYTGDTIIVPTARLETVAGTVFHLRGGTRPILTRAEATKATIEDSTKFLYTFETDFSNSVLGSRHGTLDPTARIENGKFGSGLSLDNGNRLIIPSSIGDSNANWHLSGFKTLEFWAKFNDANPTLKMDIMSNEGDSAQWDANGYDWIMFMEKDSAGDNYLHFNYHSGSLGSPQSLRAKAADYITSGEWVHVAVIADPDAFGERAALYIDGVKRDSSSASPSAIGLNGDFNLYIGGRYSTSPFSEESASPASPGVLFDGYLDEIRISDKVRTLPPNDALKVDDGTMLLLRMEDLYGGFRDLSNSG